ncbi:MAG: fatty acid CoA ligase family protein [Pirellulaceae bacterium]|nr:fatty acid CoA ligase family protein [Pirellulaceae bacterium]
MLDFQNFARLDAAGLQNVSQLLAHAASQVPEHPAVAVASRGGWWNRVRVAASGDIARTVPRGWRVISYRELDALATDIARGLLEMGIPPGTRLALMVRPGIEFIALVFGLMRAGMVQILIDPGMGRGNMVQCLQECQPQGFVGIPLAQIMRCVFRRKFPLAVHNVTVGRRYGWGGRTYSQVLQKGRPSRRVVNQTSASEQAAIIFTTGSTGPPKGVYYSHEMFIRQATQIRDFYQIEPGGVDLSGFPLFALFNIGMGVTTVIPRMDPTRPADVNPQDIIAAVNLWQANQSFGSPALWNTVSVYCEKHGVRLPSLRRVFSAGAPVPPHVLRRLEKMMEPGGEIFTPYGATEALPIASNSAQVILGETAVLSAKGHGTCVGARFPGIRWKVIPISDQPIANLTDVQEVSPREIGELMVSGSVVSPQYVTRVDANAIHKVLDSATNTVWHRMGDVGYLDERDRFWFCGRKGQRVVTATGTLFTIPVEAIINSHPSIYRSALVGVGLLGQQTPVVVLEPWPEFWSADQREHLRLIDEVRRVAAQDSRSRQIEYFFVIRNLPVDIRHNAKIFREKLAEWATKQLGALPAPKRGPTSDRER